jgi:CRP-like cAMP-binding protein
MTRISKLSSLSREIAGLFRLSAGDARRTEGVFSEVVTKTGTEIVSQGSRSAQLILVLEGEVAVTRDGEQVAILGPGSVLGEITTLGIEQLQTATATMLSPGRLAAAPAQDLPKLRACTGLYLHLQHLASKRIAAAQLAQA